MNTPLIIAEAGVNHNGDLDRALSMVDAAASAGADVIKFQAFRTEALVAANGAAAPYQRANTGAERQSDLLSQLELDIDHFSALAARCDARSIEFLATPFDTAMTADLVSLGMRRIKIASGELTNRPALCDFAATGLPILLSTGMATLDEVGAALAALKQAGATDITLLQCTSLYPAPAETANLAAMRTLADTFNCPVGYSDHTCGDHVAIAATALGAQVIEKHFTLDRTLPGPDQEASLETDELAAMIQRIRETVVALGSGDKVPAPGEAETAKLVRRSWHAARHLSAGTILEEKDIVLIRPADGLPPDEPLIGRRLRVGRTASAPILETDLE